ncbi:hypothetical protein J7T55_000487 [Diaporthe amygdali]|uniref:uncharacterized protein n=1 Tax=Phomopsis amygdali TaxID=1214568 RepID=UPI0022FDCC5F|nr:uncharacterized protein J7T55_000487 [Diaporthe amygdali]KAJ0104136.1 hypothetical protein J7T55_000487 [Diaporthe amygdali]
MINAILKLLTSVNAVAVMRPVSPSRPFGDGLLSSQELFSGTEALDALVKLNKFRLVHTVSGSDETLAPILLTAHQDVVPVERDTLDRWEHPPFDAYYNETDGYLWGRGASDDKSAIIALMSAMEALLSQDEYQPRRTVVFAFGLGEECSGHRGAGEISEYLEEKYGEGGVAVILDDGGAGLQSLGDTMHALPAVYEKGYLDVWFDLDVVGGHSSTPTLHTAIGIISEIVKSLESHPFNPRSKNADSVGGIQDRIVRLVDDVAQKYKLQLKAFEGDKDYEDYLAAKGMTP